MPPDSLYVRYGQDNADNQEHGAEFVRIRLRIVEYIAPDYAVGNHKCHDNNNYAGGIYAEIAYTFNYMIQGLHRFLEQLHTFLYRYCTDSAPA